LSLQTVYGVWDRTSSGASSSATPAVSGGKDSLVAQQLVEGAPQSGGDGLPYTQSTRNAIPWTGSSAKSGWYFDLKRPNNTLTNNGTTSGGQRLVDAPVRAFDSVLVFATVVPKGVVSSCQNSQSDAYFYALDPITGRMINRQVFNGSGLIASELYLQGGYAGEPSFVQPTPGSQAGGQAGTNTNTYIKPPKGLCAAAVSRLVETSTNGKVSPVDGGSCWTRRSWQELVDPPIQ
jgi:hypothetical protein